MSDSQYASCNSKYLLPLDKYIKNPNVTNALKVEFFFPHILLKKTVTVILFIDFTS
jgi:hypothetical protein